MAKKSTSATENKNIIKLSHAKLQLEFAPSVAVIGNLENINDSESIFNIIKTRKNIDAAMEVFNETRKKIAEDLAEKGDDGKPLTKKQTRYNPMTQTEQEVEVYIFKDSKTEAEVNKKAQQLDEKEISLEIFPIKYSAIKDCTGLRPNIVVGADQFIILE